MASSRSIFAASPFASRSRSGASRHTRSRAGIEMMGGRPLYAVRKFLGLNTFDAQHNVPRGAATNSLNFHTRGTKVEVRNGYAVDGTEQTASSKCTGVYVAHKWDGTELRFKTANNSLFYWSGSDYTEIGTNILSGAAGEDIYFAEYSSPAGAQLWVSSPNSDLIKIMVANPASYKSQYSSTKNMKGRIKIKLNRVFMWDYNVGLNNGSKSNLALSYIDSQNYTAVTGESVGTGDGNTKVFSGTLAAVTGKRTCFALANSSGGETFTDNYDGTLTGSLGGSGTINYTTGAYTFTYNTAPGNGVALTASYSWEDSTNGGLADFTKSSPRTAGQGAIFNQNDGGRLLDVLSYDGSEYCIHERKCWVLTLGSDDTTATNLIYRQNISLPSYRCAIDTAEGIYYIDNTTKSRPVVKLLQYSAISSKVLPVDLSSNTLDLSNYNFTDCFAYEWDKYIIFSCYTIAMPAATKNNRLLLYNREVKSFDFDDIPARQMMTVLGALYAGDSLTQSVFNLYANFDDDDAIPNYIWEGNFDDLGMPGLKVTKDLWIEGEIDTNQSVGVFAAADYGEYIQIGTIKGNGSYVDKLSSILVGSLIVGFNVVGGASNGKNSSHYLTHINMRALGRYKYRKIKFAPTGIGYFSFSMYGDWDPQSKLDKLPYKYR